MILRIPCTKCNGQVLERDGLDGQEKLCVNCGFSQVQNIIPTQALADESEDYNLRNRSNMLTKQGLMNRQRNHAGTKGFGGTQPVRNREKVTTNQVKLWARLKEELDLKRK